MEVEGQELEQEESEDDDDDDEFGESSKNQISTFHSKDLTKKSGTKDLVEDILNRVRDTKSEDGSGK